MNTALYLLQLFCGCVGFFFLFAIAFNYSTDTAEFRITVGVLLVVHFYLSLVEAALTKGRPPTVGASFLAPLMLWTLFVMSASPWDETLVWVYLDLMFVAAGVLGAVVAYLARDKRAPAPDDDKPDT